MAFERSDARYARQLRPVQRTVRHAHVLRFEAVAAIGGYDPARRRFVPAQFGDLRLEQHVAIQIVVLGDAPAVRENLRRLRVFLGRDVARFFEQRQIDVRLGIARRAGIAVPIPGAAEVAAFFHDANVFDAALAEARADQQSGEAAADHQHFDVVVQRRAFDRLHVRIFEEVRELADHFEILRVAVFAQTLVAFLPVLLAQCSGVEARRRAFSAAMSTPVRKCIMRSSLSMPLGRAKPREEK